MSCMAQQYLDNVNEKKPDTVRFFFALTYSGQLRQVKA